MSDLEQCASRVGTTLRDKWRLERMLGVGGMAAVYVGAHKIGRRDAIKILHKDIAAEAEVRARFAQEAQVVNRFKHPGAVEVSDIDETEDGCPFLVMELLEGEPLSRVARREGGVELKEVLRFADELLDVLVAAHAVGIIHRDIKPDNLFIQKDGRLKVLDFGIARMRAGASAMRTRTGTTLGTVSYMPPEQAKGGDIDGRADVFAVGATMFRLLAKRRVHEAENDFLLLKRMATEPAPPLASVAPQVPAAVCAVVDRALAFHAADRYPDAKTMQADIRAVALGEKPPYAAERAGMAGVLSAIAASVPSVRAAEHVPLPSDDAPTKAATPVAVGQSAPVPAPLPSVSPIAQSVAAVPSAFPMVDPPPSMRPSMRPTVTAPPDATRVPALARMEVDPSVMQSSVSVTLVSPGSNRPPAPPVEKPRGFPIALIVAGIAVVIALVSLALVAMFIIHRVLSPTAGAGVSVTSDAAPITATPEESSAEPESSSEPAASTAPAQSGAGPVKTAPPALRSAARPATTAPGTSAPKVAPPPPATTSFQWNIPSWPPPKDTKGGKKK